MLNNFLHIINLSRLNINVGYLFYIACFGIILASSSLKDLKIISIFFLGSITVRSAGCIINDIFDRNFDRYVERTKNRLLANGSVTLKFAFSTLIFFLTISFLLMLTLSKTAIYLCIIAAIMTGVYPLMKRITYLPQVFLGLTYNMGCLIGYASLVNKISLEVLILYIATGFWIIGFDTIYGYMDIQDDKKINIKSMSILLEDRYLKIWLGGFYLTFIALFCTSYYMSHEHIKAFFYFWSGIITTLIILMWQVITLDISSPQNCFKRFRANNYIGLILVIALLLSKY